MSWLSKARHFFSSEESTNQPLSRRQFFTGVGGMALGAGLLLPDDARAGVEERARQFGIKPGTLVDAQGRPMKSNTNAVEPFIGTIAMFGFTFPPRGWAFCDGTLLPIDGNQSLFSLLGTTYGGDGRQTFGLPDLRGRVPLHEGTGPGLTFRRLGSKGGSETNTLSMANLPAHSHTVPKVLVRGVGASQGTGVTDGENVAGIGSTGNAGGGQAVNNMQPFLTVNFCIALIGTFPPI